MLSRHLMGIPKKSLLPISRSKFHKSLLHLLTGEIYRVSCRVRWMLLSALLMSSLNLAGCLLANQGDDDPSGVCIHQLIVNTYTPNCSGSSTPSSIYTYCNDVANNNACTNLSAACATATNKGYDDSIQFYKGKKCTASGYNIACSSNSNNKVADVAYCPP